jgi:polyphenol oxidase
VIVMEALISELLAQVPGLTQGFGRRVPGTRAEAREAARKRFAMAGDVFFLKQVHGARVVSPPWNEPPEADAAATNAVGALLAIETADCLPVLIVDPMSRRVAAAHAGWRGTAARVAEAAVKTLIASGSRPEDLVAALGPSIGPCCYEVGPDVVEAFGSAQTRFFKAGTADRRFVDVAAANRAQLEGLGVRADAIDHLDLCTKCREDLFFSYRRDGANAGRMISVIGFSRPWA